MQLTPTVNLPGLCDEAIAFYRTALHAEVLYLRRLRDCIEPAHIRPGTEEKVLRAALRIGGSTLYLSDGHGDGQAGIQGISLSLALPDLEGAAPLIAALAEGGQVLVPLRPTAWAGHLCALRDRFGVHWTVEAGG
jgi:PhnB protein